MTSRQLPVAKDWWRIKRIDDTITHLTEPHVSDLLRCNVWHVRGRDRDLLVDTGMGISSLADAAHQLFEHDVVLVLSHTHVDHMGGVSEFKDRRVHSIEAPYIDPENFIPDMQSLFVEDLNPAEWSSITEAGYELPSCFIDAIPHAGYDPSEFHPDTAPATSCLNEGDVIDLGDRTFEVLHLPGHSPGSIGLWDESSGVLFSGDAIYDGPLLDELPGSDIESYVATMQRLRELPVEVVHGGHDPSFGRDRLRELAGNYISNRS